MSDASEEVKSRIVKYDSLLSRINSDIENKNKKEYPVTEDEMHSFADFLKKFGQKKRITENTTCPECKKGKLIKRPDKFNKGQFFLGCSNYPDCRYMAKL